MAGEGDVTVRLSVDTSEADAALARLEARARQVGSQRGQGTVRQRILDKTRNTAAKIGQATAQTAATAGTAATTSSAAALALLAASAERSDGAADGGFSAGGGAPTAAQIHSRWRRNQAGFLERGGDGTGPDRNLAYMRARENRWAGVGQRGRAGPGLLATARQLRRAVAPGGLTRAIIRSAPAVAVYFLASQALEGVAQGGDERLDALRRGGARSYEDVALAQVRNTALKPLEYLIDRVRGDTAGLLEIGAEIEGVLTGDAATALDRKRRYRLAAKTAEVRKAKAEAEPTIKDAARALSDTLSEAGRFEAPQRTREEAEAIIRRKVHGQIEDQVSGIPAAPLRGLGHQGGD